jgi:integrase
LSPSFSQISVKTNQQAHSATIWSKDSGIDRNPADQVEVRRSDDQRDRYLSEVELRSLKKALEEKIYRKGTKDFNKTFCRLILIVLIAVTTGMRSSEIFSLGWSDTIFSE